MGKQKFLKVEGILGKAVGALEKWFIYTHKYQINTHIRVSDSGFELTFESMSQFKFMVLLICRLL